VSPLRFPPHSKTLSRSLIRLILNLVLKLNPAGTEIKKKIKKPHQ
jgi:hypothetical protein